MKEPVSIRSAERKAFQTTVTDGLWAIFIGCFLLEFAIAPLLSSSMGDFWSAFIFLPFFGLLYLLIHLVRKNIVAPRIGTFKLGKPYQKKQFIFNLVMVAINLVIFALGLVAFYLTVKTSVVNGKVAGVVINGIFGLVIFLGFSASAYILKYPRLYVYGSLMLLAPLVGEWLYTYHGALHHGYPIVFGFSSGLLILVGLVSFVCLVKNHPVIEIPDGE